MIDLIVAIILLLVVVVMLSVPLFLIAIEIHFLEEENAENPNSRSR